MKKIVLILVSMGITLIVIPASAGQKSFVQNYDYSRVRAWYAESLEWRSTYLPRRYQTANVFDPGADPGVRLGAAWIIRSRHGIQGRIMTNVPLAGDSQTLWLVVFNNAGACAAIPCAASDIGNPAVGASVFNGSAAISADNGKDGGVINLDFNIVAGNIPNDLFILIGEPTGLRRGNGFNTELHLVIDQHPPIEPGPDSWIADLTTTNFPDMGPAVGVAAAIFVPCPDTSCPDSLL